MKHAGVSWGGVCVCDVVLRKAHVGGVKGLFQNLYFYHNKSTQRFLYDFCDLKDHRPHRSQATPSAMHLLFSLNQPETKCCKHFQSPISIHNSISVSITSINV